MTACRAQSSQVPTSKDIVTSKQLFPVGRHIFTIRKLIERNPPPRGGFLFAMFPDQEPGGRQPPLKNNPKK